jgi:hypothetical protein
MKHELEVLSKGLKVNEKGGINFYSIGVEDAGVS